MVQLGQVLLFLGVIAGLFYFAEWRRVRKILRVPLVPIAEAATGERFLAASHLLGF
jgi:hypothetical protein